MNRREFLAAAAATSATAVAASKDTAVADTIPIVDTHQHLWDLTKFKLAWFDPKTPEGMILGHNFTPKEYAAATKGLNVVKAVYMEVDVVPEQQQQEAAQEEQDEILDAHPPLVLLDGDVQEPHRAPDHPLELPAVQQMDDDGHRHGGNAEPEQQWIQEAHQLKMKN